MNILNKLANWLFYGALIIILLVVTPIIPTAIFDTNDPISISDKRVTAPISESDLKEILTQVRGGYFVNIVDLLTIEPYREIIRIAETKPYFTVRGNQTTNHPPKGKVIVSIGIICGPLCGYGVDIYLDRKEDKWVVIETSHWIA